MMCFKSLTLVVWLVVCSVAVNPNWPQWATTDYHFEKYDMTGSFVVSMAEFMSYLGLQLPNHQPVNPQTLLDFLVENHAYSRDPLGRGVIEQDIFQKFDICLEKITTEIHSFGSGSISISRQLGVDPWVITYGCPAVWSFRNTLGSGLIPWIYGVPSGYKTLPYTPTENVFVMYLASQRDANHQMRYYPILGIGRGNSLMLANTTSGDFVEAITGVIFPSYSLDLRTDQVVLIDEMVNKTNQKWA